jgi:YfiH family protein
MNRFILPEWPAPPHVRAATTLRTGGVSPAPFDTFNLAAHVGDDPANVARNRSELRETLQLPAEPYWLSQVHGTRVVRVNEETGAACADAAWTDRPGEVVVVMTADCLPVLLASKDGKVVAVAHAGWRGLAAGVLETTVQALGVPAAALVAWLGPALEQAHFEVGAEVREAFLRRDPEAGVAFLPGTSPGKWMADLFALAKRRLQTVGVRDVHGGGVGTFSDRSRFFSYRRDGRCGRMATLIWIE